MHLNLDKIDPEKVAVIDDTNSTITYKQLVEEMKSNRSYYEEESLVFHLTTNTINSLATHLGFVENEVVSLILSKDIDSKLLDNLLNTYKPNFIVVDGEYSASYENSIKYKDGENTVYKFNNSKHELFSSIELLMSTSGSTGSPKLVKYKKGNLQASADNVAFEFGWNKNEISLCSLPMNYTMGLNVINSQLIVGAKVILSNHNVVTLEHWELIDKHKVTNYTGVPFSFETMKNFRILNKEYPSLKTICQGGGKMTPQLFDDMVNYAEKYKKRFIASFGTTETSARMMMLDPKLASIKTLSIGKPIRNGYTYLINENGKKIDEPFTNGELIYRGPNVTLGYAINLKELAEGDQFNGEYHTGDLAYYDDEGFYYIVGRLKRFVKINSNRIGLDDVENIIKEHFEVNCAVTGTDNNILIYTENEDIKVDIREFISTKLNINKRVINVIFIEEIPRNDSGKILYSALKK